MKPSGNPDFEAFRRLAGFNGRENHKIGIMVGWTPHGTSYRLQGKVALDKPDRLAMTAAVFGLPDFTPELADALDARALLAARVLADEIARCLKTPRPSVPEDAAQSASPPLSSDAAP